MIPTCSRCTCPLNKADIPMPLSPKTFRPRSQYTDCLRAPRTCRKGKFQSKHWLPVNLRCRLDKACRRSASRRWRISPQRIRRKTMRHFPIPSHLGKRCRSWRALVHTFQVSRIGKSLTEKESIFLRRKRHSILILVSQTSLLHTVRNLTTHQQNISLIRK